jgi:hypothetical protein
MSIACLCSLGLASAAGAQQFDGRYLLSVFHTDVAGFSQNRMTHLYDVIMRQDTPNRWRLDLGAALRYDSEFSYDSDLFRARTFGELTSRNWRLHGQYVPWQRMQPTPSLPSRRDMQVGFILNQPRLPQLLLNYTRADRRNTIGESRSDDARIDVAHDFGPADARVGYRRIETNPAGRTPSSKTDEYRGGIQAGKAWRTFGIGGAYDAIVTETRSLERLLDQRIQRAVGDFSWRPHRQVTVSGNGLHRWGRTEDNARPASDPIDETNLGARLNYIPVQGLNLSATRSYLKSSTTRGNQISDYLVLQALYRRLLVRRTIFHTGYSQSIDINSEGGSIPNSSIFASIDGNMRQGMWARAESRASRSPLRGGALQWFWLLQLRTRPSHNSTFEVLWNRNSFPEIANMQQTDRTWEIKASYSPISKSSVVGSYRRLDGEGRIERHDTIWSANASWRVQDTTTFNLYGSWRRSGLQTVMFEEDVFGADLTVRPRELLQLRGSLRYAKNSTGPRDISYGVILTRDF